MNADTLTKVMAQNERRGRNQAGAGAGAGAGRGYHRRRRSSLLTHLRAALASSQSVKEGSAGESGQGEEGRGGGVALTSPALLQP